LAQARLGQVSSIFQIGKAIQAPSAMAVRSSLLPVLLATALIAVVLRFTGKSAPAFTPQLRQPAATTVHKHCKRVSAQGSLSLAGATPAIVSGKSARGNVAAHFTVKLQTPDGEESFECPEDVYILDQAEEEGIELPYSCRAGSCSSCAGKVIDGSIDQSDQAFLDDEQMDEGFCLTCVTYATSDVTIKTHCEDDL